MSTLSALLQKQPEAVRRLAAILSSGRLHHAHLLVGCDLTSARELAQAFASSLICQSPVRHDDVTDSCGQCSSCRKLASNNHPDVVTLEPDERSLIKIDRVREMTARLGLRATEASTKIVFIFGADCMNAAAQNALLKTLEEPPGPTCFLMTAKRYQALLPTVRSRTQKLQLNTTPVGDARRALQEGGVAPELAGTLAALVGDDLNRAEDLIEQDATAILELLRSVIRSQDPTDIMEAAADLGDNPARTQLAVDLLCVEVRDQLALSFGAGEKFLHGIPSTQLPKEQLNAAVERLQRLRSHQAFNPNRTLLLESVLLGLTGNL